MRSSFTFHLALWGAVTCGSCTVLAQEQSLARSQVTVGVDGAPVPAAASTAQDKGPQNTGPYWDGMRAINQGRWVDAEAIFTRNVSQPGGEYPDGSLYWEAYAQNKLGHGKDALNTCALLVRNHPASNWLHECSALQIEVRANLGHPVDPQSEGDDDLKLLALNWLMLKDEPRALADLQEILSGDASEQLKQKAISTLGHHYSDATYAEIVRIRYVQGDVRLARGEQNEKPAGEAWEQAVADVPLETGFSLTTGDNGRAEIELEDASTLYLAENSVLTFNDMHTTSGVPYTEVALLSGTLSLAIRSSISGEVFVLRTPSDDFAVRYPQSAHVRVVSYTDAMAITALDPTGLRLPDLSPKLLLMGQTWVFGEGHSFDDPSPGDAGGFAGFDQWVLDRVTQRAAAMIDVMKAAGLASPLPGLADMKGQGTFFACPPYGTCWDPATGEEPQTAARGLLTPFPAGRRKSAQVMDVNFQVPRLAAAQLIPPGSPDPLGIGSMDAFSPCFPSSLRYRRVKDPVTGKTRVVDTGLGGGTVPWGWAVCHAGAWVRVPRHHHYVWCAGEKRHHVAPVHWVKSDHRAGFVPMHPFDVKGRPPINRTQEVYVVNNKNGLSLDRVKFDPLHPIEVLKSPPHEFRTSLLRPLEKAEVPHMEAHAIRASLTVAKGTVVYGPVARPANIPIRFNARSQSFGLSKVEMHGGKSVTVSAPMSNRGGTLQARGGSFAGAHGGPGGGGSGFAGAHGGPSGGGSGGHAGAAGGSSGGSGSAGAGGHGGGGGASSGGGASGGGGSHR